MQDAAKIVRVFSEVGSPCCTHLTVPIEGAPYTTLELCRRSFQSSSATIVRVIIFTNCTGIFSPHTQLQLCFRPRLF